MWQCTVNFSSFQSFSHVAFMCSCGGVDIAFIHNADGSFLRWLLTQKISQDGSSLIAPVLAVCTILSELVKLN